MQNKNKGLSILNLEFHSYFRDEYFSQEYISQSSALSNSLFKEKKSKFLIWGNKKALF